jgi:hypothetical protein
VRRISDHRIVEFGVDPDMVPALLTNTGLLFRPRLVAVHLEAGALNAVNVIGRLITRSGREHAVRRVGWSWYRAPGRPDPWPPPGAPTVAVAAVTEVMAAQAVTP